MSKKKKVKKVLNGYNKEFNNPIKVENNIEDDNKEKNIHEKIQSFISILFTIIVFILMILLIIVLYNNYLKKSDQPSENECVNTEVEIDSDKVIKFINNNRNIIYNISDFDLENFDNEDLITFSKYIIWGSDSEYLECNDNDYCLDTKKEMEYENLHKYIKTYLNKDVSLVYDYNFSDNDMTRIYLDNNKVVLTFKNMEFESFKHNIIDIRNDSSFIEVIFALSKHIDNVYSYIGYKKLYLQYFDNRYIISKIETTIIE